MSACRGLERGLTLAYLGPEGSYSEQAALEHFGHAVNKLPCPSFDEVFRALEVGQADVGMVPVENSTEGAVNRTLDLLLNTSLMVMGERSLVIRHCLMTQSGSLDGVKTVMAHPQALAQCQVWLSRNHPELSRSAAASNAEAARVAAQDPTVAAIAGETAATTWGLQIVSAGIQDDPHNRTRFLALGSIPPQPTGKDKTSLILAVPNRAGAVYEMLAPLAENKVSMTRFESRPARKGEWEYYFYVDVLGHAQDAHVARALDALRSQVAFFKLLGSYPAQ
jgi:chorismate mutase/prephenate dehydratase